MNNQMARGSFYVLASQALFITASYLLHFGLGRYLGPKEYGTLAAILALLAFFQFFLLHGLHEAVVKTIAEKTDKAGEIYKKVQAVQFIFAVALAIAYYILAPVIARYLHDITILPYLRLSAIILPVMSLYSISQAYCEGLKRFKEAAIVKLTYSWSKLIFVLILVTAGYYLGGIVFSFFLATVVSFIVYKSIVRIKKSEKVVLGWKEILKFAVPSIIFYAGISFIMNIDQIMVKALIPIKEYVGFYSASSTICKMPFSLFLSLSTALLPFMAQAWKKNELNLTKRYIRKTLSYLLIMILPLIIMTHTSAEQLITLIFGLEYSGAGNILSSLIIGYLFIILFTIMITVLLAINKTKSIIIITLSLIPITLILHLGLIPAYGVKGAAMATTIVSAIGFIVAAIVTMKNIGIFFEKLSIIRIAIASILVYISTCLFAFSGISLLATFAIGYGIFIFALIIMKEFKKEDWAMVSNVLLKDQKRKMQDEP